MKSTFKFSLFLFALCATFNLHSQHNTIYGDVAGASNITGQYSYNSAFGKAALSASNISGSIKFNAAFGYQSLRNNEQSNNSAFGYQTLRNNTIGLGNSAFGGRALYNNLDGSYNVALGFNAMRDNIDGSNNVAVGSQALRNNDSGYENIAVGYQAMYTNSSGFANIAIGYETMWKSTSGIENIALGWSAGDDITTGNRNTILGYNSGNALTSGSNNTLIGSVQLLNGDTSNTIILADGSGDQRLYIHSNGHTGIGLGNNAIPQNKLEVRSDNNEASGLRFTRLNQTSTPIAPNGVVLTVDANGDVVLTTDQVGTGGGGSTLIVDGQNTTVSGDGSVGNPYEINAQQLAIQAGTNINFTGDGTAGNPIIINSTGGGSGGDNIYNIDGTLTGNRIVTMNNNRLMFDTDTNGAIYIGNRNDITNNANFPTVTGNYRLYVEGGVLTEKVKVALRNTTDWADYVFEDDYKLQSINEVEAFIKKNKHLPGIASAQELAKNGLDLGEMQAKQMEKIEELTLYIIAQDKAFKKQQTEIDLLKAQVKALLERE